MIGDANCPVGLTPGLSLQGLAVAADILDEEGGERPSLLLPPSGERPSLLLPPPPLLLLTEHTLRLGSLVGNVSPGVGGVRCRPVCAPSYTPGEACRALSLSPRARTECRSGVQRCAGEADLTDGGSERDRSEYAWSEGDREEVDRLRASA